MDEMRALLDTLMGTDRDCLPDGKKPKQQRFADPDVCKFYLLDFCPHDLFPNTRSDLGPCRRVHSDLLKEEFQKSPNRDKYVPQFEAEFIAFLEGLLEAAEAKIQKANRRIDAPLPDSALLSEDQQKQVEQLNEEISRLLNEAEKAGEKGEVEEAAVLSRQVQSLRREVERVGSSLYGSYMQREKSLRVCPICGAMQSVGDSMSRFESHVTGKQHQGFEKIRSCLEEMKRRRAERQKQALRGDSPSVHRRAETSSRESLGSGSGRPRERSPLDVHDNGPAPKRARYDNRFDDRGGRGGDYNDDDRRRDTYRPRRSWRSDRRDDSPYRRRDRDEGSRRRGGGRFRDSYEGSRRSSVSPYRNKDDYGRRGRRDSGGYGRDDRPPRDSYEDDRRGTAANRDSGRDRDSHDRTDDRYDQDARRSCGSSREQVLNTADSSADSTAVTRRHGSSDRVRERSLSPPKAGHKDEVEEGECEEHPSSGGNSSAERAGMRPSSQKALGRPA